MSEWFVSGLLVVVGIIHLLPLIGVVGVERLNALYAVKLEGPDLEILMRHRAVLFGILGGFFVYAAFVPSYQPAAFVVAFVSAASFLALAWGVGGYNKALRKVVVADVVALVCLAVAVVLYYTKHGF